MPAGSPTVTSLAVQIANVQQNQDELRSLLRDVLGEMLRISQTQAQATVEMLALIRDIRASERAAFQNPGPGSSRTPDDQTEYDEWRASRETPLEDR